MPIYAYKCTACGHAEDVLQKMSDNRLTECPACKKSTYEKQVTAAGFQLKGSGWYVTDFRNNAGGTSKTSEAAVGKTAADGTSGNNSGSSEVTGTKAASSDSGSGSGDGSSGGSNSGSNSGSNTGSSEGSNSSSSSGSTGGSSNSNSGSNSSSGSGESKSSSSISSSAPATPSKS